MSFRSILILLWSSGLVFSQPAWPPGEPSSSRVFNDRKTETFRHGVRPEWGYETPQEDSLVVIHPRKEQAEGAPLYVVLHSAGHDVFSCVDCTKTEGNHDIYRSPDDHYALYLDCRKNRRDWWWGGMHPRDKGLIERNSGGKTMPVEKRVIDSVRWAIKRFKIDPERVYLSGNSMGGSGALGIGMRHGNVFAAIKANVPAGVEHAAERLFFPPRTIPSGLVIPDPPICVNYSAQNDGWSVGHGEFFRAMENRRYALMLYWGPFGHANNSERIKTVNDLIDSFDWLSVRKDEAYPVFTRASGNSALPWPDNLKSKAAGQVNGFFRWKSREDTADALSVSLFLATRENLKTRFSIPEEVVADVSIRRIQDFRLSAGEKFHWEFGKIKGEGRVDEQGLITIPELRITGRPVTLRIQRGQKSEPVSRVPALRRQVEGKGWRLDRAQPENTGRPRVLLIGDSILSGYRKDVIKSLDGVAEVDTWVNPHWQSENTNALLADLLDKNGPYNVVHFNMGLHGWTEGRIKKGTFRPLTRSYVEVLKGKLPSARFIWASSTPVTRKGDTSSFDPEVNPIIVRHNMMADEVMRDAGIPVSDFYALLAGRRDLAKGDRFHWTSPAYRLLGKTATSSVLAALKGTAQGAAPKK